MPLRVLCAVILAAGTTVAMVAPTPLTAQTQPAASLTDALQMDKMIDVLVQEGLADATDIGAEFRSAGAQASWQGRIREIYAPDKMRAAVQLGLDSALAGQAEATTDAIRFFTAPAGRRTLQLETDTRLALMDKDTEAAAALRWQEMVESNHPRVAMLRQLAEVNDLIEINVAGAMNSTLAFYRGMALSGGPFADMTEAEMLDMVRASEPSTRTATEEWLFPYMAMAYAPLSDDDLRSVIRFAGSPSGRVLNAAMLGTFNTLFDDISRDLGMAYGQEMAGEDI